VAEAGLPSSVIVERIGEFPSPSVLVDGVDVTGVQTDAPAACVLNPPTRAQIRAALAGTTAAGRDDEVSLQPAAGRCAPARDPIRADRPVRAAALPAPVRQVHQRLLQYFAASGSPPSPEDLAAFATDAGVDPKLAVSKLATDDLIAIDDQGQLQAAYPFSPTPTAHTVDLNGVTVYAMCAIDALGIPYMLGTDATVESRDPHTGAPITVTVNAGKAVFLPDTAVVVYAASAATGRSVDTCCSTINFFTDSTAARSWMSAHPGLAATMLSQADAVTLGRDIFGALAYTSTARTL
jgi:hypothetical protein